MDLFDPAPIAWIQDLLGPGWEAPFKAITVLGSTWGLILVGGFAMAIWGRGPLYGILVLATVEAVVKFAIAAVAAVPRPPASEVIKYESIDAYTAFPSGHVSSATAVWTYLGFLRRIPLAVGIGIGMLVALTRLYLGVHWLVDVVGGLVIGLLLAWLVSRVHAPIVERAEGISEGIWLGIGAVLLVGAAAAAVWLIGPAPPKWTAVGFLGGVGVAIPLERRWLRYDPGSPGVIDAVVRTTVAWAGVIACLWWARSAGEEALLLRGLMAFSATVWSFLLAPTLFTLTKGAGRRAQRERPAPNRPL